MFCFLDWEPGAGADIINATYDQHTLTNVFQGRIGPSLNVPATVKPSPSAGLTSWSIPLEPVPFMALGFLSYCPRWMWKRQLNIGPHLNLARRITIQRSWSHITTWRMELFFPGPAFGASTKMWQLWVTLFQPWMIWKISGWRMEASGSNYAGQVRLN